MEPSKRYITDYFQASKPSSTLSGKSRGFPPLDDSLRAKLETAPRLARKNVSDGYKTETSLPSYKGNTIGPTQPSRNLSSGSWNDKIYISQEDREAAARTLSTQLAGYSQPSKKRGYTNDDDTDDEGDSNQEYSNVTARHIFVAGSARNRAGYSKSVGAVPESTDFTDAEFLQSREVIFD